ncbi:hypothetical protein [Polycladomyces subterraneus]|uniref:Uncharacterized protein n=1 Tax=Polycladomyces subterraneus TaxID=1016997 RepID=A0ABT8IKY9_9BACL|nr:hypothetical protein [Polycladomyces subterraneus]MDN4593411.1 hypothetical protein [Polycladomyces subterraneus]
MLKPYYIHNILGDYAGELRESQFRADGVRHVDTPGMIQALRELNVNTYLYLIWHEKTDWDDLHKEFLPAAKQAGIDVWVYLVPPSESTTKRSEPYGTDYIAWADAIGRLSCQYDNLKAWAIDDFSHNLDFYTPEYVQQMQNAARAQNPYLQFLPQMYFPNITPQFVDQYASCIDGIIMAYRDDPYRNTQRTDTLEDQLDHLSRLLKPYQLPYVLMVYASKLSATPANPTPYYVEKVVRTGLYMMAQDRVQGVVTYVLKKEFEPESSDDIASSGKGYFSFFVPAGTPTLAGDRVEIQQVIHPSPAATDQKLIFSHYDTYSNLLGAGYHYKQVLIDTQVVWEQDVATDSDGTWKEVTLDLTPYLKGKRVATLTFRLYDKRNVSNFWINVGFDQIRPVGFTLEDPDFEKGYGWTVRTSTRSMIAENIIYNPQRQADTFAAVQTAYLLYDLYASAVRSTDSSVWEHVRCLIEMADCAWNGRDQEARRWLEAWLFALSNYSSAWSEHHIERFRVKGDKLRRLLLKAKKGESDYHLSSLSP